MVITKSGVIVKALAGQAAQLVTTSDNNEILITIEAPGVTVENLALESPDRHVHWTGVAVHAQNATLRYLRINATCQGWPRFGISADNSGNSNASGLLVDANSLGCGEEGIRALILNPNGTFVYTPPPGFEGVDTLFYEVYDGRDCSDFASVRIYVSRHAYLPQLFGTNR